MTASGSKQPTPASLRRDRILERVRREGGLSVAALVHDHGVSTMTAHRDLQLLAAEGLIERVRGGARLIEAPADGSSDAPPTAWTQRVESARDAKAAIAQRALHLIEDRSTIFLDASSTALALSRALDQRNFLDLTLVTNSPMIASEITTESVHVVITPGELDKQLRTLAGRWTSEFLERLHFDAAFVSAAGVTVSAGFTTSRQSLADVVVTASHVADRTIGLADASKFGITALVPMIPVEAFSTIVTDSQLDPGVVEEFRRVTNGFEVV